MKVQGKNQHLFLGTGKVENRKMLKFRKNRDLKRRILNLKVFKVKISILRISVFKKSNLRKNAWKSTKNGRYGLED